MLRNFTKDAGDLFWQPTPKAKVAVRDVNISWKHGVVFFTSNSAWGRIEIDTASGEYASPGRIDYSISTQQFTSGKFHGKSQGNGNFDLFAATTDDLGKSWSNLQHLGNLVNTPFAEFSPVLSDDGNTLYFSSEGHGGLGGLDVFSVPVRFRKGTIIIDGKPTPVPEACSTSDDLFYCVLPETNGEQEAYFASNRLGNFDIFSISETPNWDTTGSGDDGIKRIESSDGLELLPIWQTDKLNFDLWCDTLPSLAGVLAPDQVLVRGRITDSKGRLVKKARVIFISIEESGRTYSDLDSIIQFGAYEVRLKKGLLYNVTVTAVTQDGNTYDAYLQDFLELCNRGNYQEKNLPVTQVEELQKSGAPTGINFFFVTNQWEHTISHQGTLLEYYNSMTLRDLNTDNAIRFRLEGYADERGTPGNNKWLASKRVEFAAGFLKKLNYDDARLDLVPIGEDTIWNKEPIEKWRQMLPEKVFKYSPQQKLWQLNRRVQVYFSE